MIYEGCIQLTVALIFLQLTGSLLALGTKATAHLPSRAGSTNGCKRAQESQGQAGCCSWCPLTQCEKTGIFQKKLWAPPLGQILDAWVYQNHP